MGHKKKTSLKATLQSQQTRLKNKEKAAHAAEAAELKTKHKGKGKAPALRPTIPFTPTDKILLIGEGNFSFAHALIIDPPSSLEHISPSNITATSYDSEEECYDKYPDARGKVDALRERGAEVLFGVDGTRFEKCNALKGRRFDRVVFNFPHAGKGITDQDRNILSNQMLILGFLRSVVGCLAEGIIPTPNLSRKPKRPVDDDDEEDTVDAPSPSTAQGTRGTVLITLRNVPPYTNWDVPRLAKTPPKPVSLGTPPNPNYKLLRSFVFHRKMWKGYEHRMTKGERAHGRGTTGEGGEDRTWEFCLKD
jgi:25S rRNA (uracil2634-N3)-methyltransferase